jgi:hypothetical protein
MPEIDDTRALLDMLEEVHGGGIPINLFYSVEAWENLVLPDSVPLTKYARKTLSATRHSDRSAAVRLVRKFKREYPYLLARYIVDSQIELAVGTLLEEVAVSFQRWRVPFKVQP